MIYLFAFTVPAKAEWIEEEDAVLRWMVTQGFQYCHVGFYDDEAEVVYELGLDGYASYPWPKAQFGLDTRLWSLACTDEWFQERMRLSASIDWWYSDRLRTRLHQAYLAKRRGETEPIVPFQSGESTCATWVNWVLQLSDYHRFTVDETVQMWARGRRGYGPVELGWRTAS